ncbi:hypothetical protein Bmyc01_54780 [Bacillus mycoides]|uniref:hypothetical protein n=1 Tax=Bacillus proteolyticus TaxID=2026192 RepID=UPI0024A58732|nr:hypothetical protein [Bacillus proteolyticus]GLV66809.1 hypothetical protein Bmyc01_54780 [Bacillus mycoides]
MRKKDLIRQWKADLQEIAKEKEREKKKRSVRNTIILVAHFMTSKDTYHKKNGVWKQKNK